MKQQIDLTPNNSIWATAVKWLLGIIAIVGFGVTIYLGFIKKTTPNLEYDILSETDLFNNKESASYIKIFIDSLDVHDTSNTKAILQSKDWMAIVPHIQMYRNITVTYLGYMNAVGDNMKSQISNLIARYHSELSPSQLVELENLSDAQFLQQIKFLNSIANIQLADEGRESLINEFVDMQKQYLKVEKEFGIC